MDTNLNLDKITLSHGQTKWVLTHALDLGDWSASALDSYIKFLRRGGVPFAPGETPGGPGTDVRYGFDHLMELALALVLHRQSILRKDLVRLIAEVRDELRPLFRRAWQERNSGLGTPVDVSIDGKQFLRGSGVWLDLGLHYPSVGVLTISEPKLLGPKGAIQTLLTRDRQLTYREPIKISDIAANIVRLAPEAPEIRRGRR